jgi:fused signal recognition particle receptor
MAFFKKLKDRLLRSSSKIDEGLEAIVEDGGQEDEVTAQDVVEPEPQVEVVEVPEPIQGEPKNLEVEAPKIIEPQPVIETTQVPPIEAEQAFSTAEREDRHEHLAPSEPEPEPEPEQIAAEPVVVQEAIVPTLEPVAKPETVSMPDTPGLIGRLFGRTEKKTVVRRVLDDDMLEQLEELLIATDMGVDTALRVTSNMAEGRMGKKLSVDEIKSLLAAEIARIMEPVARPMPIYPKTPQVVLVVGVNGSGKTTTIGKLACQFKAAGKQVVIAAGDTFRAAAVEQLQVWGDRAGVPVLTAPEGSDPASLAFDAMTKAQEDGADLLMIDTAGRLQNRSDLMEELEKIVRVIRKKDPTAPHNTLLVLDATTGQNALNQVKVFQEVSDVSGLVMTKLDGTAKGGVLVALADKFGLPIHAIGVGEQIDDLEAFDPEEFAAALTGAEPK